MLITLHLPANTSLPLIGGVKELKGRRWQQTAGKRWARIKSGRIEATYTKEQLALCVGLADYITRSKLDKQLSL